LKRQGVGQVRMIKSGKGVASNSRSLFYANVLAKISRVTAYLFITQLFLSIFQYDGWFMTLLKAVAMCTQQRSTF